VQPYIFEKTLHAWPQWEESIQEARIRMSFKPSLLETESEVQKWEKEVGWEKVIRSGLALP